MHELAGQLLALGRQRMHSRVIAKGYRMLALLYLHEWRGALFRVRLARLRLTVPQPATPEPRAPSVGVRAPLLALLLAVVGASAFVGGATLDLWPLWAAGLTAVGAAFISYKP